MSHPNKQAYHTALAAQYGPQSWQTESYHWRGRILTGLASHWCMD